MLLRFVWGVISIEETLQPLGLMCNNRIISILFSFFFITVIIILGKLNRILLFLSSLGKLNN